ncbi:MAG: ABC transporter permease [Actinobacteria bacterium]|nr:ABC transporter permease [Actinomycetota bacterium]
MSDRGPGRTAVLTIPDAPPLPEGAPVAREQGERRLGVRIGVVLLVLIAFVCVAAPLVAPKDPYRENVAGLGPDGGPQGPSLEWPLGTDGKGRDVLSRLIYGGRVTFGACALAIALATLIGLAIGLLAASSESAAGNVLMRMTDIGLAIPGLLLAAALTSVLGSGVPSLIVALVAVFWAPLARVTYGQAVVVKERPFVEAARSLGAGRIRILVVEITPHVLPILLAYAALSVGWAALFESSLGFLGLGVQEPTSSIGSMLGSGLPYYRLHPGLIVFPALYLGMFVTATTLIGEGLRTPHRRVAAGKTTAAEMKVIGR